MAQIWLKTRSNPAQNWLRPAQCFLEKHGVFAQSGEVCVAAETWILEPALLEAKSMADRPDKYKEIGKVGIKVREFGKAMTTYKKKLQISKKSTYM